MSIRILKSTKVKTIISCLIFTASITFSSCFNPVFYQVINDVESEEPTVSGPINSISRYTASGKELLILAGDHPEDAKQRGLRYKLADQNEHGCWKTYPISDLPFELHKYDYYGKQNHTGEQIIKVLADKDYVYLVTAEYENNDSEGTACPKKIHIWTAKLTLDENNNIESDKTIWTDICKSDEPNYLPTYMYDSKSFSAFNVFCTNSVNPEHRFAYIRSGGGNNPDYAAVTLYKLNGNATPKKIPTFTAIDDDDSKIINSAVYYPMKEATDGVIFLNAYAAVTDETKTTAPKRFYFSSKDTIKYSDDSIKEIGDNSIRSSNIKAGQKILSIAINKDSLILGKGDLTASTSANGTGGLERVLLSDSGIPNSSLANFETNAKTQIMSSYFVTCLLSVDPEKAESDNAIYAAIEFIGTGSSSTVSFKNVGLWSYYAERNCWNRE